MSETKDFKHGLLHQMDIDWAVERLPRTVYDYLKECGSSLILAGGYIRSVIAREPVNDIDLFPQNPILALKLAREYTRIVSGKLFSSENAYSVRDPSVNGMQVQFIHRWSYPNAIKLLESFDYTIGQAAIWIPMGQSAKGICADTYYQDLAAKRLVYTNPVREEAAGGSILRMLKFYSNGYRIPLNSLADIIARISDASVAEKLIRGIDPITLSGRILNLLHEVDPHTDPSKRAYTPIKALHAIGAGVDDLAPVNQDYETFGWNPPENTPSAPVVQ